MQDPSAGVAIGESSPENSPSILPRQVASVAREFISVGELAKELRLNRKTLYNAINQQQIPGIRRVGNRILVHRPSVVEWMRSGRGAVPRSRREL